MKTLIFAIAATAFVPALASAADGLAQQAANFHQLYGKPPNSWKIASAGKLLEGETRPKEVLMGVYYFGGSNVKSSAMSKSYKQMLCGLGFSRAYSVYTRNNVTSEDCGQNTLKYEIIGQVPGDNKKGIPYQADGGDRTMDLLEEIYNVIKSNGSRGPIYVHCDNGVHASNTVSQIVLKQFCGISDAVAVSNWDNVNLYKSLAEDRVENEQNKVKAFKPIAKWQITAEEQALICH